MIGVGMDGSKHVDDRLVQRVPFPVGEFRW